MSAYHESFKDFRNFVQEVVNYGTQEDKNKLLEVITDADSVYDLPTRQLDLK